MLLLIIYSVLQQSCLAFCRFFFQKRLEVSKEVCIHLVNIYRAVLMQRDIGDRNSVSWAGRKRLEVLLDYYSAAALLAMQSVVLATAIPSVRPSVCLSVTRWYAIQTNEDRIMMSSQ